eukprot:GHVR01172006.1.p1 GENE.GHVR01172006.1~~GHVR01172006.1.p1  ORF type:complete len:134 (+),score=6.04 GHVR01172006.1:3101-3502(+)
MDTRKRMITSAKVCYWIIKREGRIDEYVKKINNYLTDNPNDIEAWLEVGQIFIEKGHHLRALYCFEEIVVLCPENDYYFIKLAELYFTLGGKTNISVAIKYYSYVISKQPKNIRALWGLHRSLLSMGDNLSEN